ncbi:magnesium-translocating P-type ATPase [Catenulispora sp. NF23]|uniref:magnesium-translocating P-type ATPase n=1 Tax=Catenulispora pinistramenti TaxID=2705254 RepID=UPI001BA7B4E1|nr:magnesium-translocating P-type ATPase [Catenulispora pinistramenti]MBS2531731.1 magnesium-translocating P-type ATPase [Catenulispora pinistramenti]
MTAAALSQPAASVHEAASAASLPTADVLRGLGVTAEQGLPGEEVARRQAEYGPNAVASHKARMLSVLWHQLRSPLLGLLIAAAAVSFLVGERSDAVIIGVIVAVSVGLGFVNEYRAEKAAEALHSQIHHTTVVVRDGRPGTVDVTALVPGDLVELKLGDIVPADLRLLAVTGLECDESVLTGESLPTDKHTDPVPAGTTLAELSGCALMGTVVHAGSATGLVVATGPRTEFGKIAAGLDTHPLDTEFQVGLRKFSMLLVYVAGALTTTIFVMNVVLHKPIIDALLFSLAIAVGITPQLLPAVVSTSLAAGSRRMSRRKVLVKRLVCIEDLGDVDVLFTDKTGTLTAGRIDYEHAVSADPGDDGAAGQEAVLRWGLLCTENSGADGLAVGGNPLDQALWQSPAAQTLHPALADYARLATLPFDHERRMASTLVRDGAGQRTIVTKGAPESVLDRCVDVPEAARKALDAEFAAGNRVVAVATRPVSGMSQVTPDDERGLILVGFLVFLDPPKQDAAQALRRLADLGITVKVVTGDNAAVALKVCHDLGLGRGDALTGTDLDKLDDTRLAAAIATTTVFARVSPEDKARIVRVQRLTGGGVAFLGDGVNDALALHAADVGISVDSATDVAKDAADVILLEKDLDVLADGVAEGRRIFANTIKYVLMGTSSNFGNMASAAGASLFLSFLPMLPSQILLNNLLYDTSQLAIPTDNVDEEQLRKPSHWDIGFIRRFMIYFGPLSSVFDFITFGVMLWVFHSGPAQFRSGWFVESLATQTLVVFAIRTRRIPFFRSHPSLPLTLAALTVVAIGAVLPATPLAHTLGFQPLPAAYFAALAGMVIGYLVLIEIGKKIFYRAAATTAPRTHADKSRRNLRHLRRRAARFSTAER